MQGHSSGQHQVVVRSLLATMLREEWTVRAVRAPPPRPRWIPSPQELKKHDGRPLSWAPPWGLIQSERLRSQFTFRGCSPSQAH